MRATKATATPGSYMAPAVIHDHFNGSAHCIECGGPCQLTGTAIAYTALVRELFERERRGQPLGEGVARQLRQSGVPVDRYRERALDTDPLPQTTRETEATTGPAHATPRLASLLRLPAK